MSCLGVCLLCVRIISLCITFNMDRFFVGWTLQIVSSCYFWDLGIQQLAVISYCAVGHTNIPSVWWRHWTCCLMASPLLFPAFCALLNSELWHPSGPSADAHGTWNSAPQVHLYISTEHSGWSNHQVYSLGTPPAMLSNCWAETEFTVYMVGSAASKSRGNIPLVTPSFCNSKAHLNI